MGLLIAAAGAQDVAQEFALRLRRSRGMSPTPIDSTEVVTSGALARAARGSGHRGAKRPRRVPARLVAAPAPQAGGAAPAQRRRGRMGGGWAFGGIPLGTEIASFAIGTMRYLDPASAHPRAGQGRCAEGAARHDRDERRRIGGGVQMGAVGRHGVGAIELPRTWPGCTTRSICGRRGERSSCPRSRVTWWALQVRAAAAWASLMIVSGPTNSSMLFQ